MVNYQHGVAEVETWERFIKEEETLEPEATASHEDELAKLRALLEESDESKTSNAELVMRKDLQKE